MPIAPIERYGRDRDLIKAEAEVLERHLAYRLDECAKPDDATLPRMSLMATRVMSLHGS